MLVIYIHYTFFFLLFNALLIRDTINTGESPMDPGSTVSHGIKGPHNKQPGSDRGIAGCSLNDKKHPQLPLSWSKVSAFFFFF